MNELENREAAYEVPSVVCTFMCSSLGWEILRSKLVVAKGSKWGMTNASEISFSNENVLDFARSKDFTL